MGLQTEIQDIVNKHDTLNLSSKLQGNPLKEMTSKFTARFKITNISKLSKLPKEIKSDLDLPIPLDVDIWILSEGDNRDGKVLHSDMVESLPRWGGSTIIPFHDMEDMEDITSYNISDNCGFVDEAEIKEKDGKNWIVAKARITNRNIAYQMYLREMQDKPVETSAEYRWSRDYGLNGEVIQTNIRPGVISLVDKGHIEGNQIDIKSTI